MIERGSSTFSRWLLDPEPIRQDLIGGRHALGYVRHLVRGNSVKRRLLAERLSHDHTPVLLLHGFLGTRGSMYLLERRLAHDGLPVFSFRLGTLNLRDIRRSALLVRRKIDSLLAARPNQKIDIIGHSMGGLIGLYYVKRLGGAARVRKLLMLGTPHRGTWTVLPCAAALGLLSTSAWQLLPGSRFLRDLADGSLPSGVEYYTIAAERDWVCPAPSATLDGAVHLAVPLGHSSLVVCEEIYKRVLWALRR